MENLERMAIFARVVEDKSFSAAARRLNLSKSQVSKHITQLEKSIGARLLNRTTRALSLTDAGAAFYEHCARIVEELEEAKLAVSRLHSEPRGLLRISSSVAFGRLHIAPALADFRPIPNSRSIWLPRIASWTWRRRASMWSSESW